jgi:hypothetical protein
MQTTLKPGLLVSLNTTITGNVQYRRVDIEPEHILENGETTFARWETAKTVFDAKEDERARKVRSKVRSTIAAVCCESAFGLLCPLTKREDLKKAEADALALAEEFNATATLSRVNVFLMSGEIAADDVEAVTKINRQVRDLIDAMADGVQRLDVDAVRDAADRARSVSGMLTDDARARVAVAIKTARDAARKISKAGEEAAQEIDRVAIRKISEARTAFLDLDTPAGDIAEPMMEGLGIDFAKEGGSEPLSAAPAVQAPLFDF